MAWFSATPFEKLLRGKSIEAGDGPLIEARLDLRRSVAPSGALSPHGPTTARVETVQIGRAMWTQLDLSDSRLLSFRFHDATLKDCRLDGADCRDWRLWGTNVLRTSFKGTDLRNAVLGGVEDGRRNRFEHVDFTNADLRGTNYLSADFDHCVFANARLDGVDFQGAVFSDCRFEGDLEEVVFNRHAFRGESYPPNEMRRVDFTKARFHYVEFRGLDMTDTRWPEGSGHILVPDYPRALDRMLTALRARSDVPAREAAAVLEIYRKWVGPAQPVGVLSKRDILDCGDPSLVEFLEQVAKEAPR